MKHIFNNNKVTILILMCNIISPIQSTLVRNYKYVPNNNIPINYLEMIQGRPETILHKIDLETSKCGENKVVDLREITILELQSYFKQGQLSSEELVGCYLDRIRAMNPYLNAILETSPVALQEARRVDEARANGVNLGALHGIPVLLKDSIGVGGGHLETTAGAVALLGLKPKSDAEVVRKLRRGGAIIIGKANMSEFGNFRGTNQGHGWSGRGGRTNNAYVRSEHACGSSSGSAVAVASNLVTVALGGETDGSIICPSNKASVVGLKPTLGRVSTKGTIGISTTQDVIGPIARTVSDAAIVFNTITRKGFADKCYSHEFGHEHCDAHSKPYRIGVLRSPYWEAVVEPEMISALEKALTKLREAGFILIDPVVAGNGTKSASTSESEQIVYLHEFKVGINKYLAHAVLRPSSNKIQTLGDIISFNKEFPPKEGYNQDKLISSQGTDGLTNTTYIAHKNKNVAASRTYINYILTKYKLDAITIPSRSDAADTYPSTFPARAGYPHITIPAGYQTNGVPFGISFYGSKHSEETLLVIASRLEKVFKARRTSLFLD